MPIVVPASSGSSSSPQTLPQVSLFDYVYGPNGAAVANQTVEVILNSAAATLTNPVVYVAPVRLTTTTDGNGFWLLTVTPNSAFSNKTNYIVSIPGLSSFQVNLQGAGPFQASQNIVTPGA